MKFLLKGLSAIQTADVFVLTKNLVAFSCIVCCGVWPGVGSHSCPCFGISCVCTALAKPPGTFTAVSQRCLEIAVNYLGYFLSVWCGFHPGVTKLCPQLKHSFTFALTMACDIRITMFWNRMA